MHYYPFHPGDYASSTAHLSNSEDLCYRRLLDFYYQHEGGVHDVPAVARRIRMPVKVVQAILDEFFTPSRNGFRHKRCDDLIGAYQAKGDRARGANQVRVDRARVRKKPQSSAASATSSTPATSSSFEAILEENEASEIRSESVLKSPPFQNLTSNQEPETTNQEPRTTNRESETNNQDPRIINREPPTSNQELRTGNQELKTTNPELETKTSNQNQERSARNHLQSQSAPSVAQTTSRELVERGWNEGSSGGGWDSSLSVPMPRKEATSAASAGSYSKGFEAFWNAYPRKEGKDAALMAWAREQPPLLPILQALCRQGMSDTWTKDQGRQIPPPATYINGRSWEDVPRGEKDPAVDLYHGELKTSRFSPGSRTLTGSTDSGERTRGSSPLVEQRLADVCSST